MTLKFTGNHGTVGQLFPAHLAWLSWLGWFPSKSNSKAKIVWAHIFWPQLMLGPSSGSQLSPGQIKYFFFSNIYPSLLPAGLGTDVFSTIHPADGSSTFNCPRVVEHLKLCSVMLFRNTFCYTGEQSIHYVFRKRNKNNQASVAAAGLRKSWPIPAFQPE